MEQVQIPRCNERLHALLGHVAEVLPRECPGLDDGMKVLSLDQLHHHKGPLGILLDSKDRHHIRMLETGQRRRLPGECFAGGFVQVCLLNGEQPFQRDIAAHDRVIGTVDGAHAASANSPANLITF